VFKVFREGNLAGNFEGFTRQRNAHLDNKYIYTKTARLTLSFLGTKRVYKKLPFDFLFKEDCQLPVRPVLTEKQMEAQSNLM